MRCAASVSAFGKLAGKHHELQRVHGAYPVHLPGRKRHRRRQSSLDHGDLHIPFHRQPPFEHMFVTR